MSDWDASGWTPERLDALKKAYEAADKSNPNNTIQFEGRNYTVGYTKYLIQYVQLHFDGKGKQ
jgi:hypothetical protein